MIKYFRKAFILLLFFRIGYAQDVINPYNVLIEANHPLDPPLSPQYQLGPTNFWYSSEA